MNTNIQESWCEVIKSIPCFAWGLLIFVCLLIVLLIGCYFYFKYVKMPNDRYKHERKMKEETFKREKEWRRLLNIQESTDESLIQQVSELKEKCFKLEHERDAEKEINELLQKKLKIYNETIDKLKTLIPKENT